MSDEPVLVYLPTRQMGRPEERSLRRLPVGMLLSMTIKRPLKAGIKRQRDQKGTLTAGPSGCPPSPRTPRRRPDRGSGPGSGYLESHPRPTTPLLDAFAASTALDQCSPTASIKPPGWDTCPARLTSCCTTLATVAVPLEATPLTWFRAPLAVNGPPVSPSVRRRGRRRGGGRYRPCLRFSQSIPLPRQAPRANAGAAYSLIAGRSQSTGCVLRCVPHNVLYSPGYSPGPEASGRCTTRSSELAPGLRCACPRDPVAASVLLYRRHSVAGQPPAALPPRRAFQSMWSSPRSSGPIPLMRPAPAPTSVILRRAPRRSFIHRRDAW